ncbi:hypothetical protein IFM89_006635, partial [Coptis chinensis]
KDRLEYSSMNDKVENIATQTPPMAATYGPQYCYRCSSSSDTVKLVRHGDFPCRISEGLWEEANFVLILPMERRKLYRNYCQICSINSTGKGKKEVGKPLSQLFCTQTVEVPHRPEL